MFTTRSGSTEELAPFWECTIDLEGHGAQFGPDELSEAVLARPGAAWRLYRGDIVPPKTLTFRQERRSRAYDLLWAGLHGVYPISERFTQVLASVKATGWTTYPLVLLGKNGESWDGYRGLSVTGRVGPAHWDRSKRVLDPPDAPRSEQDWCLRGLWFDERTWDGSDLCLMGQTVQTLVTDRVARALKQAGLKGFCLQPQADVITPAYIVKNRKRGH